jgi:hypothetical protein
MLFRQGTSILWPLGIPTRIATLADISQNVKAYFCWMGHRVTRGKRNLHAPDQGNLLNSQLLLSPRLPPVPLRDQLLDTPNALGVQRVRMQIAFARLRGGLQG